jgi:large subunit ribosomal protein L10
MNRDQKAATIDALATELGEVDAVIAIDYRGMTVSDAADLRTKLRDADAVMRVVKNSLTERAADQAGVEGLSGLLQGPTALTFVRGDAALAAKTIADAARTTRLLPFKGGVVAGQQLAPEQLVALSRLPSREVLYGQLVGVVASPVSGLVRTLNALISGLAVALGQVRDQKPAEAPAPAPAPEPEPAAEVPAAEAPAAEPAPESAAEAEPEAAEPAPESAAEAEPTAEPEAPPAAAIETETEAAAEPEAEAATDDQAEQDDNQAEDPGAQPEAAGAEDSEATKEAE